MLKLQKVDPNLGGLTLFPFPTILSDYLEKTLRGAFMQAETYDKSYVW
jgi:hypothetical protein